MKKHVFSGVLLLILSITGMAEEEYIITSKSNNLIHFSTSTVREDGVRERLLGTLKGEGDCMRLTTSQFENLEIMNVYHVYYPSRGRNGGLGIQRSDYFRVCNSRSISPGNTLNTTSFSSSRHHKKKTYPIHNCGAPGKYDIVRIPNPPYIRMDLISNESLMSNITENTENTEGTDYCFNPFLEKTDCESPSVFIQCFNENNNISCLYPNRPNTTSYCKKLRVSYVTD